MLAFAMVMSVCGAVIVMSSAYVVSCSESGDSGISEVYMLKSMGERTPPCGIPHHHVVSSNYHLPSLYACLSCIIEL